MADELDQTKALELFENAKADLPADYHKRVDAWKLRIQGYRPPDVAAAMGVSEVTVHAWFNWMRENYPLPIASLEDFMRLSISRLEEQYKQLEQGRKNQDPQAQRVSLAIIDQEAKLLGAHTTNVNVEGRVTYQIEGIDMDQL
jgi:hypothetical protein